MAYTRWQALWRNDPPGGTPVNQGAMNHIEDAFVAQDARITTLETASGGGSVQLSVAQAKGDLIVATGPNAVTRLGAGGNGQVLTADSTVLTTGLKWATPATGGGGGTTLTVQDEGSALTQRSIINFVGAGVTATDDGSSKTIVTIPGGGSGVPTTRQIITSAGLTGGGDLSADRTLSVVADTTTQRHEIAKAGVLIGARKRVNLIEGSNVTIATLDNNGTNAVDVTISAATTGGSGIPASTVTAKGDLIVATANATVTNHAVGADNTLLVAKSTATDGVQWQTPGAALASLATTKGDLLASNGASVVRVAAGTDGQVLTSAAGATPGVHWVTPNNGTIQYNGTPQPAQPNLNFTGATVNVTNDNTNSRTTVSVNDNGIPASLLTTQGDMVVGATPGAGQTLSAPTSTGLVLTSDLTSPQLMDWATPTTPNPVPADYGLAGWAFDPVALSNSTAPISGTVYLIKVKLVANATVTKINWSVSVPAGGVTAGQNFVGIYNTTGTRLASVGVDSDITSTGLKTSTITSTSVTPSFVWVAMVFNATTNPQISRAFLSSTLLNVGLSAGSYRFAIAGTAQTSLPTSITPSSNTAGANSFWAAIA